MKLRVVVIILLLSLLLFFGFKKISANKNKEQSTNIEQLNILKIIPENSKLLFISNLDIFNIINNNKKDKNPKSKDNFLLIKDSILNYLGIDLDNNKIEDIYNNELIISTFENNKNLKDDILIIFKIKPEKTIDDLLNLPNKIDQIDEIISINRENKINFLNYIYRTEDNYIIASSDKKLIKFDNIVITSTPRRIVLLLEGLVDYAEDKIIERKGPKASLAYLNGCPTNAALGFAKSLDIDVGELEIKKTEKGDFVFGKKIEKGLSTKTSLSSIIPKLV